jgi:ABC-type lipoprotein export system ATPase subunit
MGAALIELAGIERIFQLGDSEVHALRRLDVCIAAGEYVAVMGPSGSGKSTLLNLLGLLDRPNAGIYRLAGRDVTTLSADEQARVRSERIGFVFQSFHLVPRLTAAENIALPMILAGIAPAQRSARVTRAAAGLWTGEPRRPSPGPTLRWAAAARRDRPRDDHAAGTDPRRRADRQPRSRHRRRGDASARRTQPARASP